MGNKMKKLICALLASAMLVSSVGMVAMADEVTSTDADAVTTEATEAPAEDAAEATEAPAEATEAPVATQAPVATGSAYDNDNYYQKALSLCSALGIITGYEDGSVKPDSKVTRAEMASIVLRMLAINSTSKYQNGFTDVTEAHWAADQIQTAQEAQIISGMGDGTFQPDGDVKYAQIAVMLVNALNYQNDAEYYGGYPNGYLKAAGLSDLNLLKNAPGEADVASERGVVIKMVYNALLAQYKEVTGYENGSATYSAKGTLAKAKFDLIDKKGVITATSKTSISGADLQEGQVEIVDDETDETKVFDCTLSGLEDYLAQKVTYYYKENSGLTPEVLAVTYDASKTETVTIKDDDIESVEGFESNEGKIKVDGVSKKKNCAGATIIYNGKLLTEAQKAENDVNELLMPEVGSVKLVDSNRDDLYDVIFVDSYETMVVSSASAERLTGKVESPENFQETKALSINLDESEDRTITVTRAGMDVKLRNLKKNDVATIKRSLDDTVVDIVVTGESVTGSATGISIKKDRSYATINGTKYDVANVATGDLKTGTQGAFYTDMFGRIAYIEASTSGKLQSGEKYGWIMNAYDSEDGGDYLVQMMTTDGKAVEFKTGSSLDFWAPTATDSVSVSSKDAVKETLSSLIEGDNFLMMDTTPIRLVKYKANSSNVLSRLYCSVDSSKVKNEDALRVNPANQKGVPSMGGAVNGYNIADGILEFSAPLSTEDMKDAGNYKIGEVTSSAYVVRESGSTKSFVLAEFENSTNVNVLINFTASANEAAPFTDMDSATSGPAMMVIDEISQGVDDEDNDIYTINGYLGGTEVSITTNKNTNVGLLPSTVWTSSNNGRNFDARTVWDGTGKLPNNNDVTLGNFLKKGDLILYTTDGKLIAKYVDPEKLYGKQVNGEAMTADTWKWDTKKQEYVTEKIGVDTTGNRANKSSSRVGFYFGALLEWDLGDTAWIKTDAYDNTIIFDSSKLFDVVTISSNGKVDIDTEGATISDLETYDEETKKGDFVFVSTANKGDINNIIIYRFE